MENNWGQTFYDQLTFEQLMNQARRGKQGVGQVLRHTFPQTGARIGGSGLLAMGSRRIPLIAGGLQALTGDPVGGLGTAGGGVAGAMIGQAAGAFVGGGSLGLAFEKTAPTRRAAPRCCAPPAAAPSTGSWP